MSKPLESESESEYSEVSVDEKQKEKEKQQRKIQKLQLLINKPFQQLSDDEFQKRRILSKVGELIGKVNNNSQFLQPINIKQKNETKFLLNMNQLKNTSMPRITSYQTDPEKDYVDYLMLKKKKQQEQQRIQGQGKQQIKENYDQLWQNEDDNSEKEIQDVYNVNRALSIVHKNQLQSEKMLKSDERVHFFKIGSKSQLTSNHQSLTNSRLILMQDQDINETECREMELRRTLKKQKTNKVIQLVQQASKKLYNIKEEQIKREFIKHQVYQQMNRQKNKKDSSKSIDSVFRNSQGEETFSKSQNHQRMITNKMSDNKFFQQNNGLDKKHTQTRSHLTNLMKKKDLSSQSPPRLVSRKISHLNDKISGLVSQIDKMQENETEQQNFIQQMKNEQDQYKTYRESLQPDQIKETLKSLLGPSNNENYKRPFRFNKKKFFNQIL